MTSASQPSGNETDANEAAAKAQAANIYKKRK